MNAVMADSYFLSALQPRSSCTAYALPSDGPSPDPLARARRVREQVQMRLAERKSSSLPRQEDSRLGSATDYIPPETKSYTQTHGFSSRSMINTPTRIMAVSAVPPQTSGFSSRSDVTSSSRLRHKETSTVQSSFQVHGRSRRSKSLCQEDQFPVTGAFHPESPSVPSSVPLSGDLRRSLSGILAQERSQWQQEEALPYQYTYRGPSHRTISRITNRQQYYQHQSAGSGQEGWVGNGRGFHSAGDCWGAQWQQQPTSRANNIMSQNASLQRAASLRSLRSVGKGADVLDTASIHSNDPLAEMQSLDMTTAVRYLSESETALQVLGTAYIQHQCYHSNDAKNQVRALGGIPALVRLFSSESLEVQRYATAATRNLIYENADNKTTLIEAGGLMPLVNILNQPDEELRKTITGVLWNLSSRDSLKERLAIEALSLLTEKVLVPLCKNLPLNPSEREIFYNTTGCLRNLSSINERTRRKMRAMHGLVDSLVCYIQQEERGDDKGLENSLCVMRNLSFQLYSELPPSVRLHLEGPSRASVSRDSDTIGCFTLHSKKATEQRYQNLSLLPHPKGADWLWHPKVVGLYKLVLQNSENSSTSREAALGALQNITAGEFRWSSVLSCVVMDQERMLPILLDLLDTSSEMQLKPLTGLLRNLARHSTNKEHMAKNVVNVLVSKLPSDGFQKSPSSEVVVNICGALNHLVACCSLAARDIAYFNGLPKLQGIKTSHDNSSGSLKAARAASTILSNMFQYSKLHRDYKLTAASGRCDIPQRVDINTDCTSCAAVLTASCPHGFTKVGSTNCSYVVQIGNREVELQGCQHVCVKTVLHHQCCVGHWGPLCLPCPSWSGRTCNFNGVCSDGNLGNGTCVCNEGFSGFACHKCRSPNTFGEKCDKECDCMNGVCNQGPDGDGVCLCQPPFSGKRCDRVNSRCSSCGPFSYCKGDGDDAECACLPGHRKMLHNKCSAVCSQASCDVNARCSLQGSKVKCTCKANYEGDGRICVPRNPCLENNGGCPINSTVCVFRGPNNFSCECMSGMLPVGGSIESGCQLQSACSPDTCDPTALCQTHLDGKPRCVCELGHIGDGRRCYGDLMERLTELDSSGGLKGNLTGAVALFERGCSKVLRRSGPFTAFFPLLKDPLTGVKEEVVCKNHLILGQHLLRDLQGRDFHLYGGEQLRVNVNKRLILLNNPSQVYSIIQSDLPGANGIIHIIDRPLTLSDTSREEYQFYDQTIGEILTKDQKFNRFLSLVDNCGAPPPLRGPGPLTVFVPTNEAVDRARDGSILYMLNDAKSKLQELLRHHVFSHASLTVDEMATLPHIQTMANQLVSITLSDNGQIMLGEKLIPLATTNIMASNGVIHMIDGLLYPTSILPILPHRCDVTDSKIIMGPCVHCSFLKETRCPEGSVELHSHQTGCEYTQLTLKYTSSKGCAKYCNTTRQVPECCKGFYGPDCKPCIGGFQHPCYDKGSCFDGIHGNGSCICHSGFKGFACHICADPAKHGESCDEECHCVHGVCDNRPGSGGACRRGSCLNGYSGEFCDKTATPCNADGLLQHCHIHAYCTHTGLDTTCVCRYGYEGDGHSCSPINLCLKSSRGDCDTNAECVFVGPGNVSCVCSEGWTGDGKVCVEINNCQLDGRGGCSPNADCNHIGPGQSECVCKTGYMGNGKVCDLISPCLTNNGGCHDLAKCEQREGRVHTCTCPDGYAGDGNLCYGSLLDELDMNTKLHNFYKLIQKFSQSSQDLSGNITVLVPSHDVLNNMSTADNVFWTSRHRLPHFLRAHFLVGIYSVEDLEGLVGSKIPTLDPSIQWEIRNVSGTIQIGNASIVIHNLPAINGYIHVINQDSDSFLYHVIPNELLLPEHLHDGLLKSTLLGSDYQVQFHLNINQMVVNNVPLNDSFIETQYGLIFILPKVLKVQRNRCSRQVTLQVKGICSDCDGAPRCLFNYIPIKEKFPPNMKPNCVFRKRVGSRRRSVSGCMITCLRLTTDHSCCPGFYGHECFKCPGENDNWCSNHGKCQDGNHGNGECRCYEGFHGTACEDCEPGRYGVNCSSKCVCDHGKCEDGLAGSGKCVCIKGWKGASCSVEIKDDACRGVCDDNANCITGPKGSAAACVCAAGYEGNGTFCKELDVCGRSNGGCSEFAVCTKLSGGERTCTCKAGYTGDGVVCLEIDGCLVNNGGCHRAADCIRTGPNVTSCRCRTGFSGSGKLCFPVNPCRTNNGDCSKFARCEYLGQGRRNCTCFRGHVGDGFVCRGTIKAEVTRQSENAFFRQMLWMSGYSGLHDDGVYTLFVPLEGANNQSTVEEWRRSGRLEHLILYHLVPCEILTLSDLKTSVRAISVSGYTLYFSQQQGSVWINNVSRIVKSDYTASNGVIHHIDTMLTPYKLKDRPQLQPKMMNFSTAATVYGYRRFYQLIKDAGLLPVLQMSIHQPFTFFWPTDKALNSLPTERQRWLYSPNHQDQLTATIKAHIIRNSKLTDIGQPRKSSTYRTMHGSLVKLSCDRTLVGGVLLNDNSARLVERYMEFKEGLAFGIDQLLEPPGLGAFCDAVKNRTTYGRCGSCFFPPPCPSSSIYLGNTMLCSRYRPRYTYLDLEPGISRRGCMRVCQVPSWVSQCCKNHYSRDCKVCPGGVEAPCSRHGDCDDGLTGSGVCRCYKGFRGHSCQLCASGYYGVNCTACSCGTGRCDEGVDGTGQCICESGWEGDRCQNHIDSVPENCRQCHAQATCVSHVGCQCKPGFEGNGTFCSLMPPPDLCSEYNGGCDLSADCNQTGLLVNCTCRSGYRGDGFSCEPINRCVEEQNGGCSDFASCKFTGPNERECECLPGFVGNGVQCLERAVPPTDRCLEDNGGCDIVATCKDLHYHANTAGVFHIRSTEGKYKMNLSQAEAACQVEGATLATFKQLGDAQQLGMHLCVAGWMEGGKVGYPTRFPSAKCGDNHVGLVIYKDPVDQGSKFDAYCYRLSDVSCSCPDGYVGNGDFCNSVLTSVLAANNDFSIFYKLLLDHSGSSSEGKQLVEVLTHRKSDITLFVPLNSGFTPNQTLSRRDLEYHISANHSRRLFKDLRNQEVIASRLGLNLTVTHCNESCTLVNQRLLLEWDIPAVNGIIHVIEAPLTAPSLPMDPGASRRHVQATSTVLAILVMLSVCALTAIGYYIYTNKMDVFRFHYFKNEDEHTTSPTLFSIPNPLYGGSKAFEEPFGDTCQGAEPKDLTNTLELDQ
nr:stabilin-1 isoform X5 [Nothobranchius furzeri]